MSFCLCMLSYALMYNSFWPRGWPARLLCPWDFPGKNTGVGCHFLLQGIFPTQGSNFGLLTIKKISIHKQGQWNIKPEQTDIPNDRTIIWAHHLTGYPSIHLVQFSHSVVSDSVTPWTAARQASLSITNSQSSPKLMSCPQSLPASECFPMSQLFAWGGQSTHFQL